MNCDICDEEIVNYVQNDDDISFSHAKLVWDIPFEAHLECAIIFNSMQVSKRIGYLNEWRKSSVKGLKMHVEHE